MYDFDQALLQRSFDTLPLKAISIKQPWAWLICDGWKPIENRNWKTKYRGPVAVHASKQEDKAAMALLRRGLHPVTRDVMPTDFLHYSPNRHRLSLRGGIVGIATLADVVDKSDSDWFVGDYGFVMDKPLHTHFVPCKGALNLFDWRKNFDQALLNA